MSQASNTLLAALIKKALAPGASSMDCAVAARAAALAGYTKTAEELGERAQKLGEVVLHVPKPAVEAPASPTSTGLDAGDKGMPSPFKEIAPGAWTKFVRVVGGKTRSNAEGPAGELGIFRLKPRRLCDLGICKSPKKSGKEGKWSVEWSGDHSKEKFLASPPMQYRAFVASMASYRKRMSDLVGKNPTGLNKPATLSGLLAVAHAAGETGARKWFSGERRVPTTTAAYSDAEGIF